MTRSTFFLYKIVKSISFTGLFYTYSNDLEKSTGVSPQLKLGEATQCCEAFKVGVSL